MEANTNDLVLQLDNLARQLFVAGYGYQSVLVRGAVNELSLRNITPRVDEIKICAVKNHRAWANDNGFELIRVVLDASPDPIFAQIFDPALGNPFASWKDYVERYISELNADFHVIHAAGVMVSHVKSFGRWDIFSSSYDLLLDQERNWLRYLDGKGIYRAVASDLSKALIDFTGSRIVTIKDRCVFIGSHPNWGHWMQDFFTKVSAFKKLQDSSELKLVFGRLSRNQRSCLTLLGIPPEQTIELESEGLPGEAVRYFFDDLICIPEIPKPAALRHLRKLSAEADVGIAESQPELIYISRRTQVPRHRVSNIDEVEGFFTAKGFVIVNGLEEFGTGDVVALLRKAKIIVMASGADLGTLALCGEDAVVIILLSDGFLVHTDPALLPIYLGSVYGLGLPVVLVAGKCVSDTSSSNILERIDEMATYRLEDLDRALERAVEFRAIAR